MTRWRAFVERSLVAKVPREQQDSPAGLRRRQIVSLLTLLTGAIVLGISLRIEPGSAWFYPATLTLAGVWVIGAFAAGPLHLGRIANPGNEEGSFVRPVVPPLLLGLGLAGVFVAGGLVVRQIDPLAQQVSKILDFANEGSLPILVVITAVNGVAEELFFRGAGYAAVPRHPIVWTTVAYVIATAATGNIMLAFAAVLLGVLVGLQRRASGGILAPILTHCSWSVVMLIALPLIFNT